MRAFRAELQLSLTSFLHEQEMQIVKIPRELRGMTMREISVSRFAEVWTHHQAHWGGTLRDTLEKITASRLQVRQREEASKEAEKVEVKGKRKRGTNSTLEAGPSTSKAGASWLRVARLS